MLLRQDEARQDRLAEQLALFLSQLHAIPRELVEQHKVGMSEAERSLEDWSALFPLDISEQSRPILKTTFCLRHPDLMLLDQLPRNRVQLGEKERELLCQAILPRLVLPQEHLT